jgi:hypothetical protein
MKEHKKNPLSLKVGEMDKYSQALILSGLQGIR